ncbi:tetratricopeptide repeat protein [Cerasicoccus arenae]|uniref:Tetratricopeptide repeat protein n=1 Tax=Cerasicoccus arenae TaxID=424488 RepID=A0A8J3DBE5_9BACT|nr:tetratricopeptide repeat protein [Cerasicoccus arenae]MBK1856670.1 tetratricopeptide repeat protein [Cerasicoccus arenae]GHB98802.1 hypothetical protein GCM10007047_13520 [Cerasicoccus arenae]
MIPRISIYKLLYKSLVIGVIASCFAGCGSPDDPTGEALLTPTEKGLSALKMFDYDEAYQQLSKVQPTLAPTDPQWLEVTFAYALASWHRPPPNQRNIDQAAQLFNEMINAKVSEEWKTRAQLSLARIYEVDDYIGDKVDLAKAREIYRQVQNRYPTGDFGYQASLRLAQTYVQELEPKAIEQGIDIVREQIARDPESPWAAVAYQFLGDIYIQANGDAAAALKAYQMAEKIGFSNNSRTDAYLWRMAGWAKQIGEEPEAVRLWTHIVEEFPRSPYGTLSRDNVREYALQYPEKGITAPELKTW